MTRSHERRKLHPKAKLTFYAAPVILLTVALLSAGLSIGWDVSRQIDLRSRFLPPGGRFPNGRLSLLGADQLGRDVLLQICVGAPIAIFVGLVSVLIAAAVGTAVGLASGYVGGWTDTIVMRVVDMQLGFPPLLLAIVLGGVLGPSLTNLIISLSVIRWATFARLARNLSLQLRERAFVEASRAVGAPRGWIIVHHILPLSIGPIIVVATSQVGLQMLAEAALSFVGFGIVRPLVTWGLLINEGRAYLSSAWWVSTFPGVALMLYVFAISIFGDALQDYFARRSEV